MSGDSRLLSDLKPQVRALAEKLLSEAEAAGIPLTVTFTFRSMTEQANLYAQGRTRPGRIVTNAKPGYSFHNYGCAIDVIPTAFLSLTNWGDNPHDQANTDATWKVLGAIGKHIGFRWGGDFTTIKDRPHFEYSGNLTLADLRAGKRLV